MKRGRKFATAIAAAGLLLVQACLAGCQSAPRHYTLHGQVVSKDAGSGQLTVNHGEIPGFMAAMAMPYNVKDPQGLRNAQPGDQINADVVVAKPNDYWLEHLVVTDSRGRGKPVAEGGARALEAGERVPDVPLINQDGKKLSLRQFKGQAVLITFIYTRCPLPNFCPLISSQFASIHKQLLTDASYPKTHLVSITLDPAFDRPAVLRNYGLQYLGNNPAGFADWDFVASSPGDLRELADAFGLEYSPQEDQIAHSMQTVLVAPNGTVLRSWPGNDWRTQEVLTAVEQAAGSKPSTEKPQDEKP